MAKIAPSTSSDSPPPPPYSPTDRPTAQLDSINLTDLDVHAAWPTSSHVICHLKLLHAIHTLRQDISARDGLFGINDCPRSHAYGADSDLGKALVKLQDLIREKRWAVFVARAVDRFTVWWDVMKARECATPLTLQQVNSEVAERAVSQPIKPDGSWLMNSKPPLDVLMIWHCFMLDARAYLEDCLRQGMMALWNRGMPWNVVNAVIERTANGAYVPGEIAKADWKESTKLAWDNIDDSAFKYVSCPDCQLNRDNTIFRSPKVVVPWTNAGEQFELCAETLLSRPRCPLDPLTNPLETVAEGGSGFVDGCFEVECRSCSGVINHDLLQAGRFFEDAKGLQAEIYYEQFTFQDLINDESLLRPMKGAVLCSNGKPFSPGKSTKDFYETQAVPNGIVAGLMNMEEHFFKCGEYRSIPAICHRLDRALKEPLMLHFATSGRDDFNKAKILPAEHMAINNMMARYTSNSSPFAIDLVGACIRQGDFINKMAVIDWLYSSNLSSMTSLLLQKYLRFMDILATNPREPYVSTLDVDLARNTHKLTPRSYYDYTTRRGAYDGSRSADHDEDPSEAALLENFMWTCRRYEKRYREPYSSCTCLSCKAIRAKYAFSSCSAAGAAQRRFNADVECFVKGQSRDPLEHRTSSHPHHVSGGGSSSSRATPHKNRSGHSWSLFDPSQPSADSNKVYTSRISKVLHRVYERGLKGTRSEKSAVPSPSVSTEENMDQLPPPYEDDRGLQIEGKGKEKANSRARERQTELDLEVVSDLESDSDEKHDEKCDDPMSKGEWKVRAGVPNEAPHPSAFTFASTSMSTSKIPSTHPLANDAHSSSSHPCSPNPRKSPGISIYGPSSASHIPGSPGVCANSGAMGIGRRCGGPVGCGGCG